MGMELELFNVVVKSLEYKLEESELASSRIFRRKWSCPKFKDMFIATRTLISSACPATRMAGEDRFRE